MAGTAGGEGIFASVKNIAATLVDMGHTRLELIANEVAFEKQRFLRLLVMAQVMVFCLVMSVFLLVMLVTLLFWDQRVFVVGAMAAFFLSVAGGLYFAVQRLLHPAERVFANSLAELEEDVRQLRAASGHEQKPD